MSRSVVCRLTVAISLVLLAAAGGSWRANAQKNVVQPGDPVIASSSNSPGSEGVANAIDGTQAKYLNFDMANDAKPAGFIVTPSIGATVINGIAMQSANVSSDRDPREVTV